MNVRWQALHDRTVIELRRTISLRYPIIALALICSAVLSGGRGDWNYFVDLGRDLVDTDRLAFYKLHGDAQTGPLPLLMAAALSHSLRNGFVACVAICGLIGFSCLAFIEHRDESRLGITLGRRLGTLLAGLVLCLWWGQLGSFGHLDDAVVVGLSVVALDEHISRRTWRAGIAVGLAIAFKPWAIFLLPLSLRRRGHETSGPRSRLAPFGGVAIALTIGYAAWLPFIIAEPSSLQRLSPTVQLADDSVLGLFGLDSIATTSGLRVTQLLVGMLVALIMTLRGRPHAALPAAIAFRMVSDPGTWGYYTSSLVLVCIVWEFWDRRAIVPWLGLVATIGLAPEFVVHDPTVRAWLRLCTLVCVIVVVSTSTPELPLVGGPRRRWEWTTLIGRGPHRVRSTGDAASKPADAT